MSYRVVWEDSVDRAVRSWALPDPVFVEMRLRMNRLSQNPADQLVRATDPFDGMIAAFSFVDPDNRLCEHFFVFLLKYSQDEESLHVLRGSHARWFV